METISFINKKIGIWGFGIVGKSVYEFIKQYPCSIQILDKQIQNHPEWIAQNEQSTEQFLQHNDMIIASPGIPLHKYEQYHHKFVCELDIYGQLYSGFTIAITGTIAKTSVTTILAHCLQINPAGNIGYPMLSAIMQLPQPSKMVLELSSFQLHYIQNFAPDIAIWTNFYDNHLDHHQTETEYFDAKCSIFKYQNSEQIAIIPCDLITRIKTRVNLQAKIFLTCKHQCPDHDYPTFQLANNQIILTHKDTTTLLQNLQILSHYTYSENWLHIIAALHVQNIDLANMVQKLPTIPHLEHRLEKFATYGQTTFYNDSKSTVWQATKEAVQSLANNSCTLFLGGLSKGADRTPLITYLQNKPITVLAFGKEAQLIKKLCDLYQVPCSTFCTLEEAIKACFKEPLAKNILFSPAGSSYDLFKNYQERGNFFKKLIKNQISYNK